ncbi:MAG: type III pantothenate kinase [Elusimicrobia bacterium]|nr:type III pantothenate kinase [Elusimicrobiota bacterium]
MLLVLDVGNTHVTVGAFLGERRVGLWRLATDTKKTSDEYGAALSALLGGHKRGERATAAVYGTVVPALSRVIESAVRDYFGLRALAVTPSSALGIRLRVEEPAQVGVDRILNALAMRRLYGVPAVVLDFGTATTFDCVSARGDYLGGAILPGPLLSARALGLHTAQLPVVDIRKPRRVIGKNTVECIQSGLYFGYLGMVERVLAGTLEEMRPGLGGRKVRVFATGGLAPLFARDLPRVERVIGDLTLQGLRLAYEALSKPLRRGGP